MAEVAVDAVEEVVAEVVVAKVVPEAAAEVVAEVVAEDLGEGVEGLTENSSGANCVRHGGNQISEETHTIKRHPRDEVMEQYTTLENGMNSPRFLATLSPTSRSPLKERA